MRPRQAKCFTDYLTALAAWPQRTPFHALIGSAKGVELLALIEGLRKHGYQRPRRPRATLLFLSWRNGWRQMPVVRAAIAKRPIKFKHFLTDMVRHVPALNGTRDAWTDVIADFRKQSAPSLGLVCHSGIGNAREIREDLICLLPLMGSGTLVVLWDAEREGPTTAYQQMLRKGWHGVWHGFLAELQRPAMFTEETE